MSLNSVYSFSLQLYEEARNIAERIEGPQHRSTAGRIRSRVQVLHRSALASKAFSLIQIAKVCGILGPIFCGPPMKPPCRTTLLQRCHLCGNLFDYGIELLTPLRASYRPQIVPRPILSICRQWLRHYLNLK